MGTPRIDTIEAHIIPAGVILEFGGTVAPAGFLICNGASLLRTSYPDLFAAIGTNHGAADSLHFNIPDHRGRVARMTDSGAARDLDAAARTAANVGGATGDNVGSVQADQYISHSHPLFTTQYTDTTAPQGGGPLVGVNAAPGYGTTNVSGGTETRMKNAGVNKIIKY